MSNRVEELESQIAELQAAVDGLTEELVETRERLRKLEAHEGVDNTRTPERRESSGTTTPDPSGEGAESVSSDPDAEASTDTGADTNTDTDAAAETEGGDDSDSDRNDIINA
ncbi:DUF7518 family protein [Haloplanus sp.]|uniref:DUF7518 family protein n=1 Tax=Haloplanus sp. TaxID=1961696 RepID=UPI0026304ED1|nr:chromosome segregation protein SMC [Haloplanus sp.]